MITRVQTPSLNSIWNGHPWNKHISVDALLFTTSRAGWVQAGSRTNPQRDRVQIEPCLSLMFEPTGSSDTGSGSLPFPPVVGRPPLCLTNTIPLNMFCWWLKGSDLIGLSFRPQSSSCGVTFHPGCSGLHQNPARGLQILSVKSREWLTLTTSFLIPFLL